MSVVSRKIILERLRKPISDPQSIVITPMLNRDFDYDAIDLSLGCYFRLPVVSGIECIKPHEEDGHNVEDHYPELIHRPFRKKNHGRKDSTIILQPRHTILASTLEYIKIPGDMSGQILTKSSWARIFVSIASAPWIHPYYRGCLTLEICNMGSVPVELEVGKAIAQLVLFYVDVDNREINEDNIEGTYLGAVMPEAPNFKNLR
ncbi:MAG: hypothetical protein JW860_12340 [Sedimentisphaerales bacterium]|nr:hypothetical protein [Sedimentisphaerales bacterium]